MVRVTLIRNILICGGSYFHENYINQKCFEDDVSLCRKSYINQECVDG